MNIVECKVKVPCAICGKEYEATAYNGHLTYPHICKPCAKDIVNKWVEQGVPICNELKPLIVEKGEDK